MDELTKTMKLLKNELLEKFKSIFQNAENVKLKRRLKNELRRTGLNYVGIKKEEAFKEIEKLLQDGLQEIYAKLKEEAKKEYENEMKKTKQEKEKTKKRSKK